jgi:hypothetical protein
LNAKQITLPKQYHGVLLQRTEEPKDQPKVEDSFRDDVLTVEDDEEGQEPETATMQITAEFTEMIVWSHESTADSSGDPYVRSMEEWLGLSEKVSSLCF